MAEAGACATKIVGSKMVKADSFGIPLDGVPDYIGLHSIIPSSAVLRNSPEHLTFRHSRAKEPRIDQRFTPDRHRNRSQSSSLPQACRRSPSGSAVIAADPVLNSRFRSVANRIRVAARSSQRLFSLEGCVEKWHSIALAPGL
jgi:hypothetical protein